MHNLFGHSLFGGGGGCKYLCGWFVANFLYSFYWLAETFVRMAFGKKRWHKVPEQQSLDIAYKLFGRWLKKYTIRDGGSRTLKHSMRADERQWCTPPGLSPSPNPYNFNNIYVFRKKCNINVLKRVGGWVGGGGVNGFLTIAKLHYLFGWASLR